MAIGIGALGNRMLTRRLVLVGGFGTATAGFASVLVLDDVLPGGSWLRRRLRWTGTDGIAPNVAVGPTEKHILSSAARNTAVTMLILRPASAPTGPLPVCLVMSGRGMSPQGTSDQLGLPQFLTAAESDPPFALVLIDGGDHYWHEVVQGDDPMRMALDEVPRWLAAEGLPRPSAVLGVSMGGFGALLYARRRAERNEPLAATAVISPALFRSWQEASVRRKAFAGRADWERTEPLRHLDGIDGKSLGVWCGTADVFFDAARELADRSGATMATFTPGAHTDGYWRRVLPEALRFVGGLLSGNA